MCCPAATVDQAGLPHCARPRPARSAGYPAHSSQAFPGAADLPANRAALEYWGRFRRCPSPGAFIRAGACAGPSAGSMRSSIAHQGGHRRALDRLYSAPGARPAARPASEAGAGAVNIQLGILWSPAGRSATVSSPAAWRASLAHGRRGDLRPQSLVDTWRPQHQCVQLQGDPLITHRERSRRPAGSRVPVGSRQVGAEPGRSPPCRTPWGARCGDSTNDNVAMKSALDRRLMNDGDEPVDDALPGCPRLGPDANGDRSRTELRGDAVARRSRYCHVGAQAVWFGRPSGVSMAQQQV